MSTKYLLNVLCFLIITSTFVACKKKEERTLIKAVIGTYECKKRAPVWVDGFGYKIEQTTVEIEISKSVKGIKIKDLEYVKNFEVNESDSTIIAEKNGSFGHGKFYPNDSIHIILNPSGLGYPNSSYSGIKVN